MTVNFSSEAIPTYDQISAWLFRVKTGVAGGILAHLDQDTDHLDRVIELAEFAPLPGTVIAAAFYQADINAALTRLGLFMGAGRGMTAGTLVALDDPRLLNYQKLVAGHNLPGQTVGEFRSRLAGESDARFKASDAEAAVLSALSDHRAGRDDAFYLIGVSVQSTKPPENVISHEIFHAYYELDPTYRAVVGAFWREDLNEADRAAVFAQVVRAYNVERESLVIDEFQAYVLQEQAERDQMKAFVPKYRRALIDRLRASECLPDFVRA